MISVQILDKVSPVSWSCWMGILQLQHLCRGIRPPTPTLNECPGYKLSDGKSPDLEIWGMWSTPSLPLFPGPRWPGVVALDKVISMAQIKQTVCKQMTDVNLWLLYNNTWNYLTVCKKELRLIYKYYPQNVFTNHTV